ncbi:jg19064 [Pararge aegeria aegeria]|uniref:Jg19064 protein n=1 Tax=Pararge aegeria aegeria TaxID=348720 RepID=A0A8S4SQN2_9NEOP|nr:jg19064 [Pararge aegeria aegeria]
MEIQFQLSEGRLAAWFPPPHSTDCVPSHGSALFAHVDCLASSSCALFAHSAPLLSTPLQPAHTPTVKPVVTCPSG